MKTTWKEVDPRRALRRLDVALASELPDDLAGRAAVARLGIDIDALAARIEAKVAAAEAKSAEGSRASGVYVF